jgi:hypothetical protein
LAEERLFFVVCVVSILIGLVLALTGYKPLVGYGPEPPEESCTFDPAGHPKCKELAP